MLCFNIFTLLIVYVIFSNIISGKESREDEDKSFTLEEQSLNTYLDYLNERFEFIKLCDSTNLNISVVSNNKKYFVDVSFEVSNSKFKYCYEYYNITLEKKGKKVDNALVRYRYDNKKEGASHKFKNVTCGLYEMTIRPCYNSWQCAPYIFNYPELINMTSAECLGLKESNKLLYAQFDESIIVIKTVISILLILAVSALSFCYYWLVKPKYKLKSIFTKKQNNGEPVTADREDNLIELKNNSLPTVKIEVCILHYCNKVNKIISNLLKDFCKKCGYYNSVTATEDLLGKVLFNVNDWLEKMLEKKTKDGSIRKIILIVSEENDERNEYEIENLLFSEFLDKINDNPEQCLKGYDHIFVVQFGSFVNYPEKFRNVVRRVRFSLSEGLIEDHLINLCLNLCSESILNMPDAERKLRELLYKHPIKDLGNALLNV